MSSFFARGRRRFNVLCSAMLLFAMLTGLSATHNIEAPVLGSIGVENALAGRNCNSVGVYGVSWATQRTGVSGYFNCLGSAGNNQMKFEVQIDQWGSAGYTGSYICYSGTFYGQSSGNGICSVYHNYVLYEGARVRASVYDPFYGSYIYGSWYYFWK